MSVGTISRSVQKNACGSFLPSGSRTSTHRMGVGGLPLRYQRAVSDMISSTLFSASYQRDTMIFVQYASGVVRKLSGLGSASPLTRGRPNFCDLGGDVKRLASSLNQLIRVACERMELASSWVAKLLSPTKMTLRSGSQRMIWSMPCLAQSVSFLCLKPRVSE